MTVLAAVDWGTSRLRLWLLDADGNVIAGRSSDEGLTVAAERGFETILESHLAEMGADGDLPAIVCGMAGSRQGWLEAPYVEVPAAIDAVTARTVNVEPAKRPVRIIPGLSQRGDARADVMRGEETQLLGIADLVAEGTHLVCLPGTHSKWVECHDGKITGFRTFMTGELFALLSRQSILRHSVLDGSVDPEASTFRDAARRALADPAAVNDGLFSIRAGALLDGLQPADALATLSGLLVGAEVATALRRSGSPQSAPISLIASGGLAQLYAAVLSLAGCRHRTVDAETAVRAGLFRAARESGLIGSGSQERA